MRANQDHEWPYATTQDVQQGFPGPRAVHHAGRAMLAALLKSVLLLLEWETGFQAGSIIFSLYF